MLVNDFFYWQVINNNRGALERIRCLFGRCLRRIINRGDGRTEEVC